MGDATRHRLDPVRQLTAPSHECHIDEFSEWGPNEARDGNCCRTRFGGSAERGERLLGRTGVTDRNADILGSEQSGSNVLDMRVKGRVRVDPDGQEPISRVLRQRRRRTHSGEHHVPSRGDDVDSSLECLIRQCVPHVMEGFFSARENGRQYLTRRTGLVDLVVKTPHGWDRLLGERQLEILETGKPKSTARPHNRRSRRPRSKRNLRDRLVHDRPRIGQEPFGNLQLAWNQI